MKQVEPTVVDMGSGREWPGRSQISGFGGGYEDMCRMMMRAGLEWLDAHPEARPVFKSYKDVFGLTTEENAEAHALSEAILSACPDCSGAMHHAVVNACLYVKAKGYPAYCASMLALEAKKVSP